MKKICHLCRLKCMIRVRSTRIIQFNLHAWHFFHIRHLGSFPIILNIFWKFDKNPCSSFWEKCLQNVWLQSSCVNTYILMIWIIPISLPTKLGIQLRRHLVSIKNKIHLSPLSYVISRHEGVGFHFYTDDTQLFVHKSLLFFWQNKQVSHWWEGVDVFLQTETQPSSRLDYCNSLQELVKV